MLLDILLEEQVQDIALLMSLLKFNIDALLQALLPAPESFTSFQVNACIFLNRINHGDALKRLAQIHLNAVVNDLCCAKHFLCHVAVQILCQIHHAVDNRCMPDTAPSG